MPTRRSFPFPSGAGPFRKLLPGSCSKENFSPARFGPPERSIEDAVCNVRHAPRIDVYEQSIGAVSHPLISGKRGRQADPRIVDTVRSRQEEQRQKRSYGPAAVTPAAWINEAGRANRKKAATAKIETAVEIPIIVTREIGACTVVRVPGTEPIPIGTDHAIGIDGDDFR